MDGLRWLLLIFGVLMVAGVYWYSRREASRPSLDKIPDRLEPSLGVADDSDAETTGVVSNPDVPLDEEPPPGSPPEGEIEQEAPPEKIVTLRIIAPHRGAFAGDELALGLRAVGMRHGRFGIFHYYDGDDENRVVFSAASLVEPGSFDLANLREQKFPGISLFMVLPGPVEGVKAFDTMMTAARELTTRLSAELLDETGSNLSIQRERYIREEIIQYQLGIKVA
ncbi:MAG: cell division protein ZipA C-terminal FtsZ-binding domain-containing protein [Woeseia sp.]|nr:cell division protein ZipA C-terminal FtsZ-binding domain-containing protein [Woeseia sp.]